MKPFMPAIKTYREAIFSGWFGPMGVGAVFLAMIAKENLEEVYKNKPAPVALELVSPVVLFIVLSSTLVHGTTIPLFKIGKRIRTRTLSITSTGSGQVNRLPKVPFTQQQGHKNGDDDYRHSYHEGMTELQRNTLINTLQQERLEAEKQQLQQNPTPNESFNTDHATIVIPYHERTRSAPTPHDTTDDDLDDEDLLPGEDDENTAVANQHIGSHSIRFLEPVNPRATCTSSNGSGENVDSSVSSFKARRQRKDDGVTSKTVPSRHGDSPLGSGTPLTTRRKLSKETISRHDGVNVWDEDHYIVVEDKEGTKEEVVEKQGDHWKQQVQAVIDDMEKDKKNSSD
jgi:hypothetical protein